MKKQVRTLNELLEVLKKPSGITDSDTAKADKDFNESLGMAAEHYSTSSTGRTTSAPAAGKDIWGDLGVTEEEADIDEIDELFEDQDL